MKTTHKIHYLDARKMDPVPSAGIDLVVTSPPYPMIEMWDPMFAAQDPAVAEALERSDGWQAFESMHRLLDPVWAEVHRVLVDGGIACINIGDATRTLGDRFALYPNHARILVRLVELGFVPLPVILWRKQTNAPNKFMGSGMLPPGAYVTLEHEHILIVRKGGKRGFLSEEGKGLRRESAFFWEERNRWFSDVWSDLKGTVQGLSDRKVRDRSAAFPFELPYRLINMFSIKGDTVLDPFLGVGTTMLAAMASGRNSIGFEIDPNFAGVISEAIGAIVPFSNIRIAERLEAHGEFVRGRFEAKGTFGYRSRHHGFPVVTRQEMEMLISPLAAVTSISPTEHQVEYSAGPQGSQFQD